jgi:dihydrofolate reductase
MRRIRYCCAVSLDGYIAGPGGEFDWIVTDPEMDFGAMSEQFDAYLLGRKTFEATGGGDRSSPGVRAFVFSRTLRQSDYKNVTIAVVPTMLGGGVPLVAEPASRIGLTLKEHRVYEKTGTVSLVYSVNHSRAG